MPIKNFFSSGRKPEENSPFFDDAEQGTADMGMQPLDLFADEDAAADGFAALLQPADDGQSAAPAQPQEAPQVDTGFDAPIDAQAFAAQDDASADFFGNAPQSGMQTMDDFFAQDAQSAAPAAGSAFDFGAPQDGTQPQNAQDAAPAFDFGAAPADSAAPAQDAQPAETPLFDLDALNTPADAAPLYDDGTPVQAAAPAQPAYDAAVPAAPAAADTAAPAAAPAQDTAAPAAEVPLFDDVQPAAGFFDFGAAPAQGAYAVPEMPQAGFDAQPVDESAYTAPVEDAAYTAPADGATAPAETAAPAADMPAADAFSAAAVPAADAAAAEAAPAQEEDAQEIVPKRKYKPVFPEPVPSALDELRAGIVRPASPLSEVAAKQRPVLITAADEAARIAAEREAAARAAAEAQAAAVRAAAQAQAAAEEAARSQYGFEPYAPAAPAAPETPAADAAAPADTQAAPVQTAQPAQTDAQPLDATQGAFGDVFSQQQAAAEEPAAPAADAFAPVPEQETAAEPAASAVPVPADSAAAPAQAAAHAPIFDFDADSSAYEQAEAVHTAEDAQPAALAQTAAPAADAFAPVEDSPFALPVQDAPAAEQTAPQNPVFDFDAPDAGAAHQPANPADYVTRMQAVLGDDGITMPDAEAAAPAAPAEDAPDAALPDESAFLPFTDDAGSFDTAAPADDGTVPADDGMQPISDFGADLGGDFSGDLGGDLGDVPVADGSAPADDAASGAPAFNPFESEEWTGGDEPDEEEDSRAARRARKAEKAPRRTSGGSGSGRSGGGNGGNAGGQKKKSKLPLILLLVLLLAVIAGIVLYVLATKRTAQPQSVSLPSSVSVPASSVAPSVTQPAVDPIPRDEWYMKLVNRDNVLTSDFTVETAKCSDGVDVDARIVDALNQMIADAKAAGMNVFVKTGYRTYAKQNSIYQYQVSQQLAAGKTQAEAEAAAALITAPAGASEHNLGLAVDILSNTYPNYEDGFATSAEAQWLADNAAKYGFILRYPADKESVTGFSYEPWHFRYVGVDQAQRIKASGLSFEEYLQQDAPTGIPATADSAAADAAATTAAGGDTTTAAAAAATAAATTTAAA